MSKKCEYKGYIRMIFFEDELLSNAMSEATKWVDKNELENADIKDIAISFYIGEYCDMWRVAIYFSQL